MWEFSFLTLDQTHNPCIGRAEYFFFRIYLFIYLIFWLWWVFIAAYGLSLVGANSSLLCAGFSCNGFSCCGAQTLGVQASVAAVHGLSNHDSQARESCLSSCGTRAQLLHSMWDLPGVGVKLTSPALAGRFKTTRPPGKSLCTHF